MFDLRLEKLQQKIMDQIHQRIFCLYFIIFLQKLEVMVEAPNLCVQINERSIFETSDPLLGGRAGRRVLAASLHKIGRFVEQTNKLIRSKIKGPVSQLIDEFM